MKTISFTICTLVIIIVFLWLATVNVQAQQDEIHVSPVPFDGGKPVSAALEVARRENKNILLQSCAQGCTWCILMKKLLTTNPELVAKIKKDFVYVVIDTTTDRSFYKKYAHNTDHTLVLAAINVNGKQISEKIGFDLVEDNPPHSEQNLHIDPKHILAMLNEWSQKN